MRTLLNTGVCGNGIWEPPEQCDCGGAVACTNNTCCNADCTLKAGKACKYVGKRRGREVEGTKGIDRLTWMTGCHVGVMWVLLS